MSRFGLTETDFGAPRSTITRRSAPPRISEGALPPITFASTSTDASTSVTADLRVHTLLGKGGMGVVQAAEQCALKRDVAVKTVSREDDRMRHALVREARTIGGLEHPNIVPIHALGLTAAGDPVLVMKLIDGVPWRTLIDDDAHPLWATLIAGHGNRTRASVEVLLLVARALAFAHSRGILHRDLKPENVMIGSFGEVYLVDWGIALRLDERETEPEGIVGTLAYLAPEMARGNPRELDVRTDVYLLGAVLYELLTGSPPHAAATPMACLASALMSEVTIPDGVPPDIAALLRSTLSRDPMDRPQDVEAFRVGMARHMAHVDADKLIRDAQAAIARADALVAEEGPSSQHAFLALVEARFGFRSALKQYESEETRQLHDACLRRLVDRELAVGDLVAAKSIAAEMKTRDPQLDAHIISLEGEQRGAGRSADSWREFVAALNAARTGLRRGDASAYSALWSRAPGVAILDADGGRAEGWLAVSARIDRIAAEHGARPSTILADNTSDSVGADMGLCVTVERDASLAPLRVTHVARLERGAWRVVQQH